MRGSPTPFEITPDEAEAFWARVVDTSGCWEWQGARRRGYGTVYIARLKRQLPAHRVAYTITHGPIPEGLFVMHRCDNLLCVNPDHLKIGTIKKSKPRPYREPSTKTRRRSLSDNRRARLTPAKVEAIRRHSANGMTYKVLAKHYGVCIGCIGAIVRRETWKSVS